MALNPQQYIVYPGAASVRPSTFDMGKMMEDFMPLMIMIMMMSMLMPMMKSMTANI